MVIRKLIRPELPRSPNPEPETTPVSRANGNRFSAPVNFKPHASHRSNKGNGRSHQSSSPKKYSGQKKSSQQSLDITYAENFYYLKQMKHRTPMVVHLIDGETLNGTIEWYDKDAIKLNRQNAPNLLVLKQQIKYFHKDEDAAPSEDSGRYPRHKGRRKYSVRSSTSADSGPDSGNEATTDAPPSDTDENQS